MAAILVSAKVSVLYSKINKTFPKSSQRFYLAQTLIKHKKHNQNRVWINYLLVNRSKNQGIKIQLQVKLPMEVDERGDAFRGIPKLWILGVLRLSWGCHGHLQAQALATPCSIIHQIFTQNLKTSQHKTQSRKPRELRQRKKTKDHFKVL